MSGRVQGVGFRFFVQHAANNIGVSGYVRNLEDGRVEAYAIGTPEQHKEFAGHLWKGPTMADVRNLETVEAPLEKVSGFRVV